MQEIQKQSQNEEPMEVDETPQPSTENRGNPDTNNVCNGVLERIVDEEGGTLIGDIYIPPAPKPALTFDATGPRLIISNIVNRNFKSYAGEQILGPFHKVFFHKFK